jgi:hypothetical protein
VLFKLCMRNETFDGFTAPRFEFDDLFSSTTPPRSRRPF